MRPDLFPNLELMSADVINNDSQLLPDIHRKMKDSIHDPKAMAFWVRILGEHTESRTERLSQIHR